MLLQTLALIHHITTMLFGIFLSAFFLGTKQDRKNILLLLSTGAISGLLYYPVVLALGTSWADPIYPLLVHLPLFLLLVFYYKYRWLPALVSILTAYLCCQFSNWAGILAVSYTHLVKAAQSRDHTAHTGGDILIFGNVDSHRVGGVWILAYGPQVQSFSRMVQEIGRRQGNDDCQIGQEAIG